ncbi:MAG: hypothetical protein K6E40_14645 [Desulfovibrio sp.]|nr:hypothetical protein [Desulfovibrio sp.]
MPDWVENARINDDLRADAYEAAPPYRRALLKTGMALAHAQFGVADDETRTLFHDGHAGFLRGIASRPADWCMIFFGPGHKAAARMTAACVQPRLCGVRQVYAVCLGGLPSAEAMLSFELSGVEDVYSLDEKKACAFAKALRGAGRLLFLKDGDEGTPLPVTPAMLPHIRSWQEGALPVLFLRDPDVFNRSDLAFAQGAAPFTEDEGAADAIYLSKENAIAAFRDGFPPNLSQTARGELSPEALLLTPGCEGFWAYPDLKPDFFTCVMRAYALAGG